MTDSIGAWRQKGRVLRLLGRDIFTIESGDEAAPTILFIHGFPTSSWDWAPLWERLEGYRFVALDLLGFGYSEKPNPHRYRIMEQADLCEALVRERGLDEFHVLVHDYGVTVGQELLARQNEGVGAGTWKSACFLNGGLFPETHRARLIQKLLAGPLGPLVNKLSTKRTFDKSFSAVFGPAAWSKMTVPNRTASSHNKAMIEAACRLSELWEM